ncbi:MAG: Ig-like domain-containing protein, partial [Clostridia bacterium]|nr:Ig-like domain-containing protein [Clostridia bacterium]
TEITLSNPGDGHLINWTLSPADTTDTVSYSSSDPDVATVDENGKITGLF